MTRKDALWALVRFDRPIEAIRGGVDAFHFDWDRAALVVLTREHVAGVLCRWLAGELTETEVEDWANLVEGRDDLDLDPADPAVADAIFDLANPLLQGELPEIGRGLVQKLTS